MTFAIVPAMLLYAWNTEWGLLVVMALFWLMVGPPFLARTARRPALESLFAALIAGAFIPWGLWNAAQNFLPARYGYGYVALPATVVFCAVLGGVAATWLQQRRARHEPIRLPAWSQAPGSFAILVAALPAALAWGWNGLEGVGLAYPVNIVVFLAWWAAAAVIVLPHSASPKREALLAGAITSVVVVATLVDVARQFGGGLGPYVVLVGGPVIALTMGCAALAGRSASRRRAAQERGPKATAPASEGPGLGVTALVAGVVVLAFAVVLQQPWNLQWPPQAKVLVPYAAAILLLAGAIIALRRRATADQ